MEATETLDFNHFIYFVFINGHGVSFVFTGGHIRHYGKKYDGII